MYIKTVIELHEKWLNEIKMKTKVDTKYDIVVFHYLLAEAIKRPRLENNEILHQAIEIIKTVCKKANEWIFKQLL